MTEIYEKGSCIHPKPPQFKRPNSNITLFSNFTGYVDSKFDQNEIAVTLFLELTKVLDTLDRSAMFNLWDSGGHS